MALVKLTNVGKESFVGIFDGKEYIIDPSPNGEAYIIVEVKIAKHWFGDWDEKDENKKRIEAKRIKMLTRESPKPEWKINIEAIKEEKRKEDRKRYKAPPVEVNPLVSAPDEEEFPGLKELKKTNKIKDEDKAETDKVKPKV